MLEWILEIDTKFFLWINHQWQNSFFDWLFPNITDLHKTIVFKFLILPALIFWMVYKLKHKGFLYSLFFLMALGVNDFVCGKWIKPYFQRPRPPNAGLDVIVRSPHFGQFGFVSNHAANCFLMATFLSFYFPKKWWLFYSVAFLIALSRVYVGVHYPGDVLVGAMIGSCFGYIFAKISHKFLFKPKESINEK